MTNLNKILKEHDKALAFIRAKMSVEGDWINRVNGRELLDVIHTRDLALIEGVREMVKGMEYKQWTTDDNEKGGFNEALSDLLSKLNDK